MVIIVRSIAKFEGISIIMNSGDQVTEIDNLMKDDQIEAVDSLKGWLAAGLAFASMFICFGVVYSFGAFFDSMVSEFKASSSATSAVFSITTFIFLTGGIVSGMVADRIGARPVLIFGGISLGLGLCLTSLVNSLWVTYITFGVGVGVGVACGYVPMLAVVGAWFERRRAAALGIAVTGVGLGTLIATPLAAALIGHFGWRRTYVIFGITSVIGMILCGVFTPRPPVPPGQQPGMQLRELVKIPVFRYMYLSGFFLSLALFFSIVYLVSYATTQGIDEIAAASLMGISGGASVVGRLGFGAMGDKISRLRLYQSTFLILTISFLVWLISANSFPLLIVYAVMMGAGWGGFIALSPVVAAEIFGPVGLGTILGATYTAAGFAGLLGPTLAGHIIDKSGSYQPAIIAAMIVAFAGFLLLIPIGRYLRRREREDT